MDQRKNNRYWLARNFHAGNCNLFRNEPKKQGKIWMDKSTLMDGFPETGIPITSALLNRFGIKPVRYSDTPKVVYISCIEISKERYKEEVRIISEVESK